MRRRKAVQIRIKNADDFWTGVRFLGFRILAIIVSGDYPMGSAMRMGAGYFPTWLSIGTVILGTAIALRCVKGHGESSHLPGGA